MPTHTIFPPFHPSAWRAIDDRIRGGSSVSHLDAHPDGVRFWGTLDTQTLGGAGFASQCYTYPGDDGLWLPAERYAGLGIEFDVASLTGTQTSEKQQEKRGHGGIEKPTRYTLVLKTGIPPTRPDGRRQSTISYEYTFSTTTTPTHDSTRRITIPWSAFVPTYRGRTITPSYPEYIPLDPGSTSHGKRKGGVREVSLMCRSDFGKQEGEFEVVVRRLEAIAVVGREGQKGDLERQLDGQEERRIGSRFPGMSRISACVWDALLMLARSVIRSGLVENSRPRRRVVRGIDVCC